MNTRRKFIRYSGILGAGFTAFSTGMMPVKGLAEGKNHPTSNLSASTPFENDLTTNPFEDTIILEGKVFDRNRRSGLSNATIEIWHCDACGNMNMHGKKAFTGKVITANDGTYKFKTHVPGRFKEQGITKSKRIFVKVSADGYKEQSSTLYLDIHNHPFIDGEHFQNSKLFQINDLPLKLKNGRNSIRYNHYLT